MKQFAPNLEIMYFKYMFRMIATNREKMGENRRKSTIFVFEKMTIERFAMTLM